MKSETPRTDTVLLNLKSTPEYAKEKDTDRDRALWLARTLERELNEANDKLAAALLLCADNGINVKSITVAAMPNGTR